MDIELEAEIAIEGVEGIDAPIRIAASGPYRTNEDKLPSFDIDLDVSASGPGSTVSTGRLSTGDRTFVKFGDSFYEVDRKEVAAANRQLDGPARNSCTRKGIGIDPRPWVEDAKEEGEEQVAGVQTTHVSGRLDVDRMLRGLNDFVGRCGQLLGTAAGEVPEQLRQRDLDQVAQIVSDPSFDIYVGKDDDIVRRLSGSVEFTVPEEDRERLNGMEGGSVRISIEFANVNGDQKIEAPTKARPLSELTRQLGADALSGGLGGLGTESEESGGTVPGTGGTEPPGGAPRQQPGGEDFQAYADCLEQARPDDDEALQRCSALLSAP